MLDATLALSAALMGLSGSVHCAGMCGATCTAVVQGCSGSAPGGARTAAGAFHLARVAAYAAAGAVAAGSVSLMAELARASAGLRPLWLLAHLAAMGLGAWLLVTARQPAWLERVGTRRPAAAAGDPLVAADGSVWHRLPMPGRAAAAGSAWVLWPCGLLQSALVVAALASQSAGGAMVMGSFALASSLGLVAWAPAWAWIGRRGAPAQARAVAWAVRGSGALLLAASAWAAFHDLFLRVVAACFG